MPMPNAIRYSASEKLELLQLVWESNLSVRYAVRQIGISRSTYYAWLDRYQQHGLEGLSNRRPVARRRWNRLDAAQQAAVLVAARTHPDRSAREIAALVTDTGEFFVSESTVLRLLKAHGLLVRQPYILLKAAEKFHTPTTRIHQLWQTDFTYFHVQHWGWYYLHTVMDDYSRFVLAWRLCADMTHMSAIQTQDLAREFAQIEQVRVRMKPRLLTDNGSSFLHANFEAYLKRAGIEHIRTAPHHPTTQGKIERFHLSSKNRLLLNLYATPERLEQAIGDWVQHYNHVRYHEGLGNVTPADMYHGRQTQILSRRQQLKLDTLARRKALASASANR